MTGYVTEILGDDRVWQEVNEAVLAGWPQQEFSSLSILNQSSSKTVTIDTLNVRPQQGPQGIAPILKWVRITTLSDGIDCDVISFDSNNTALPSQVLIKYEPTTLTITANSQIRRQMTYTGMNIDRALQRLCSRMTGSEATFMDFTSVGSWTDSSIQKTTYREGEGFALQFDSDSGPNIFTVTIIFKNFNTGETYYVNKMIEPLFMSGAPVIAFLNGAGSGAVYEVYKVQIREVGDDQIPFVDFLPIDGATGGENVQVVWADSTDAIPSDIVIKKKAMVTRAGFKRGAILSRPKLRTILTGESPWGPNIASGPNIARRGFLSNDMRSKDSLTAFTLNPGEGIAVVSRNPSGNCYAEMVVNFTVNVPSTGGGTYPAEGDVRVAITYGPTGADYTGNITLPVVGNVRNAISYGSLGTEATGNIILPAIGDVRLGTSYGANGTEATGTLAPGGGGGGGNRIFYPGGWG
jgi:hypothetical protein